VAPKGGQTPPCPGGIVAATAEEVRSPGSNVQKRDLGRRLSSCSAAPLLLSAGRRRSQRTRSVPSGSSRGCVLRLTRWLATTVHVRCRWGRFARAGSWRWPSQQLVRRAWCSPPPPPRVGRSLWAASEKGIPVRSYPPPPRGVPGGRGKPFGLSTASGGFSCLMDGRGSGFVDANCHNRTQSLHIFDHHNCCRTGVGLPQVTAAARARGAAPILAGPWSRGQRGYGQVKPRTIVNGGDPTGLVTRVRWSAWGGTQAVGSGTGLWVVRTRLWPRVGKRRQRSFYSTSAGATAGRLTTRSSGTSRSTDSASVRARTSIAALVDTTIAAGHGSARVTRGVWRWY
jgi:hypothetical protein